MRTSLFDLIECWLSAVHGPLLLSGGPWRLHAFRQKCRTAHSSRDPDLRQGVLDTRCRYHFLMLFFLFEYFEQKFSLILDNYRNPGHKLLTGLFSRDSLSRSLMSEVANSLKPKSISGLLDCLAYLFVAVRKANKRHSGEPALLARTCGRESLGAHCPRDLAPCFASTPSGADAASNPWGFCFVKKKTPLLRPEGRIRGAGRPASGRLFVPRRSRGWPVRPRGC